MSAPRRCQQCHRRLVKHADEASARFAQRVFCGRRCQYLAARRPLPDKTCVVCGVSMTADPIDRRSVRNLRLRVTCGSRACREARRVVAVSKPIDVHGVALSVTEIANMLGLGDTTVHERLRRGRSALNGGKWKR